MGEEPIIEPPRDSDERWPGQPGYRTQPGHSGLDPIETGLEVAYLEGLFLRRLFTGRLRTRRPLYLLFMLAMSILLLFPLAVCVGQLCFPSNMASPGLNAMPLVLALPLSLFGFAFLANFSINILGMAGIRPGRRGTRSRRPGDRKRRRRERRGHR